MTTSNDGESVCCVGIRKEGREHECMDDYQLSHDSLLGIKFKQFCFLKSMADQLKCAEFLEKTVQVNPVLESSL